MSIKNGPQNPEKNGRLEGGGYLQKNFHRPSLEGGGIDRGGGIHSEYP